MGLMHRETPNPTSIPVGHNGGILHGKVLQQPGRDAGQDLCKGPTAPSDTSAPVPLCEQVQLQGWALQPTALSFIHYFWGIFEVLLAKRQ